MPLLKYKTMLQFNRLVIWIRISLRRRARASLPVRTQPRKLTPKRPLPLRKRAQAKVKKPKRDSPKLEVLLMPHQLVPQNIHQFPWLIKFGV
jgi:hypothetical protein